MSSLLFLDFLYESALSGSDFTGANLRESNLNALEGIGVIFENVDFRGCGSIGSFVHEGTLCLRNCIGQDGKIIELFNEDTVRDEIRRGLRSNRKGTTKARSRRARKTRILGDDVIPF